MRKVTFIISAVIIGFSSIVLYMLFVGGISGVEEFYVIDNDHPYVDYDYLLERFAYDEIVGYVHDAEAAKEIAESIWIKEYGEGVREQQPYNVLFNRTHGIWLVYGTLPDKWDMGGTAGILIQRSDGKILAVWHDR